jgi:flavodoxin I
LAARRKRDGNLVPTLAGAAQLYNNLNVAKMPRVLSGHNPGVSVAQIGLFFGSDEGNTESVAYRIQQRFGTDVVDVFDIADVTQLEFAEYDKIILGISTWDFGQIQSDWEEFWGDIEQVAFAGKTVALFGLGDQFGYGDFFLDAMGMLHDVVVGNGADIVGHWPTEGYDFDASKAQIPGESLFVGLALDEDQQSELTKRRLDEWCAQVHRAFALTTPLHIIDD